MFNCVLLIPDGVGLRNFVLGPFLPQLTRKARTYVFHMVPPARLPLYAGATNGSVEWLPFEQHRESFLSFTLRYSLAYAQMYWAGTRSMRHNLRLPLKGSWRNKAVHRAARVVGRLSADPGRIQLLDRAHCRVAKELPAVSRYCGIFQKIQPSIVFCSHQRPPEVLPAVLAARSLGIPTATFIFSWDNITSKGRIAAPFDHYLVWSQHMKDELLKYYPDVRPDQVHIVGTPQFDPYADRQLLWSRQEFCERLGADPDRPLICYSGGDTGNSPEDQDHLRVLLTAVRDGRVRNQPQVVLRPSPVDEGSRYDPVRRDFPELLTANPAWVHTVPGEWSRVIPLPEDVQMLANLTHHANLNVNFGSTMTLDFGIHDRPVVNVAFDVASPPVFGMPVWDFAYQFEHYTHVVRLGAARFARSPEELVEHVNAYLHNPALDAEGRRQLFEMQVGIPLGQSGPKIIETLESLAR